MWRDTESDNKDVISNNENQIINLCVYTGMEMMFIHTNKDIYIYIYFFLYETASVEELMLFLFQSCVYSSLLSMFLILYRVHYQIDSVLLWFWWKLQEKEAIGKQVGLYKIIQMLEVES